MYGRMYPDIPARSTFRDPRQGSNCDSKMCQQGLSKHVKNGPLSTIVARNWMLAGGDNNTWHEIEGIVGT